MGKVTRENGNVEDSELDGNTVVTVTINGIHPTDDDMLDRFLQFVMIEMGVETTWQTLTPTPLNPDSAQQAPPPPEQADVQEVTVPPVTQP